MALSGTMSNPSDWLQFYNLQSNTLSGQALHSSTSHGHVSSGSGMFGQDQAAAVSHHEATVVTTTAATASASAAASNPSSSNNTNSLSPEGRVSKPVRKRSRASRRTPTTLLNTDTANFRAMVQQFTGGPSTASFSTQTGATNFGFGSLGARQGFVNPSAPVMVPPPGYNNHLQLQQQQQNPYLLSLNNNNNNNNSDNHGFVQRLMSSSSSARPTNMGFSFSSDGMQGQPSLVGSGRPNSNPSNENRSNSFLY
ncbi:VQ motif-containing protein 22-like [Argentina anserina]|uniref:VQ motif-containing protein 22-like n=1 Tax=Argentina anserina TaxID=57926 RepID=UPI00217645B2|nr:VQ motif-containing protein 22-like [Potentilla anserina]